jgi:hypothetical protein
VKRCAILCVILAAVTSAAYGGILGLSVGVDYRFPDWSTVLTTDAVTAGPGVEMTCPDDSFALCTGALLAHTQTLDIGDWTIDYHYTGETFFPVGFGPGTFSGLVFSGLNVGIGNVLLDTEMSGLDLSRVSFTSNSVSINLGGLSLYPDDSFQLTVIPAGVPEPGSCALFATGLLSFVLLVRRRRA